MITKFQKNRSIHSLHFNDIFSMGWRRNKSGATLCPAELMKLYNFSVEIYLRGGILLLIQIFYLTDVLVARAL